MSELMMDPAYEGWAGIIVWDYPEDEYEEEFLLENKRRIPVRIKKPNRKG